MFRKDSFLDRLSKSLSGREERAGEYGYLPPSFQTVVQRQFGLPPPFRPQESQQAYSDNPWLYSAINVIANEVARTKFRLVQDHGGKNEKEIEHQAVATLARPQALDSGKTMLTRMQLLMLTVQYLFLNGESFWLLDGRMKPGNSPTIISPLNPAYIWEKLNDDGSLKSYVYRFLGGPNGLPSGGWEIPAEDVVHFKFPDPKNWYRGHSPIQPIRYGIESYREADVLNANRLKNNAIPAGTLSTDQNIPEGERQKLKEAWRSNYGGPDNAGKVALLPYGLKFNQTQMSNHDMQFIEGKNLTRDEILGNMRVGMEMLGKSESKTRSNADASIYVFSRFTVLPVLEMIADTLTNDYLPTFPKTDDLEFIFDDPVPENEENKRANAQSLFAAGAITPDEVRQMFGMEALNLPGTKVPYVPFSVIPMGSSPPLTEDKTNPVTAKKKDKPKDVPKEP